MVNKKPSVGKAFEKEAEAKFMLLEIIWPFLLILFIGIIILVGFVPDPRPKEYSTWAKALILGAVIINIIYYIWTRHK